MRTLRDTRAAARPLRVYPVAEGLLVGVGALVAIVISAYFIYARSLEALNGEIKEGLLRTVATTATAIDGDLHRTFTSKAQRSDPSYLGALASLEAARTAARHVRYAYTNVLVDGKVYFVVNPSPQNDNDGDGLPDEAPALMDPYPDAGAALISALTTHEPRVDEEPYTDRWGTFISAYAPFYDRRGQLVGTLGMDLELTGFVARLYPVVKATKRAAIVGVVLAILWGTMAWYTRRSARALLRREEGLLSRLEEAEARAEVALSDEAAFMSNLAALARRPLEQIRSCTGALLELRPGDGCRSVAEGIGARSRVLEELIDEAMEYTRLALEHPTEGGPDWSLPDVIADAVAAQAAAARARRITVSTAVSRAIPRTLSGDRYRLRRVLETLLLHGARSPYASAITLEATLLDEALDAVRIGVAMRVTSADGSALDGGTDRDPFEPFPPSQMTSPDGALLGLKLPIARRFIALMHGAVESGDDASQGRRFAFSVLLKRSRVDPDTTLGDSLSPVDRDWIG